MGGFFCRNRWSWPVIVVAVMFKMNLGDIKTGFSFAARLAFKSPIKHLSLWARLVRQPHWWIIWEKVLFCSRFEQYNLFVDVSTWKSLIIILSNSYLIGLWIVSKICNHYYLKINKSSLFMIFYTMKYSLLNKK